MAQQEEYPECSVCCDPETLKKGSNKINMWSCFSLQLYITQLQSSVKYE